MYKKISMCLLAVIVTTGLMAGCIKKENTPPPGSEDTPQVEETPGTGEEAPGTGEEAPGTGEETPGTGEEAPLQTPQPDPSPFATPEPTPTPEPKDLPAVIGEYLGSVPALIMGEAASSGTAATGEVFAVALEEDVSTGYLWRWEGFEEYDVESKLDTRYEPEDPAAAVPGMHLWAFRISEPGVYALNFSLVAPGGGVGDVQRITVTVE